MFETTGSRLVLRFCPNTPGQFTFSNFCNFADDEQLYNLAHKINAFQTDRLHEVFKVNEYQMSFND